MIPDTSRQDTPVSHSPRRRGRIAAAAAVATMVAAAAVWSISNWQGAAQAASAASLRIAPVERGTLVRDAAVNGRIVAAVSPTLYAAAPGTVALRVNAGDAVKKGDVLAQLESPELASALRREQSAFEELQAEVARQQILARKAKLAAQRDADQAEIERAAAQRALERVERAGIEGVIAKNDFQKAQDALKSAEIRGRHASAAALLENDDVRLQLKTRESQLQRQRMVLDEAKRKVEGLTLRAPMDGVIGSLAVANRAVVAANAPLMTLVDLTRLEVELEIPETYVADLGLGMDAEITAGEVRTTGKLAAISPEVIRNQVLARVRFPGRQPAGLRQSQRVSARLLIERKSGVLVLPRGPFVEAQGGRFAYVVQDGVAYRRAVTLGAVSVDAVEITSGLQPGEKVVIAGTESFQNAEQVRINE